MIQEQIFSSSPQSLDDKSAVSVVGSQTKKQRQNWHYYDKNGEKIGPITTSVLRVYLEAHVLKINHFWHQAR